MCLTAKPHSLGRLFTTFVRDHNRTATDIPNCPDTFLLLLLLLRLFRSIATGRPSLVSTWTVSWTIVVHVITFGALWQHPHCHNCVCVWRHLPSIVTTFTTRLHLIHNPRLIVLFNYRHHQLPSKRPTVIITQSPLARPDDDGDDNEDHSTIERVVHRLLVTSSSSSNSKSKLDLCGHSRT